MAALDWLKQVIGGGDPLDGGLAYASSQPSPDLLSYAQDVLSGKVAAGGALGQNNYDPNRSFAQNALDPRAIEQATDVAFGIGPGAIRAYHGSPHSFDRFDLSKIGTGEGAQAYGHGLYFAENERVARGYRDTLATGHVRAPGREVNLSEDPLLGKAARHLYNANGDYALAAERIRRLAPDAEPALQKLREMDAALWPGHMYEVDIHADPKAFLDWDRPVGQQSAQVQEALRPGLAPYMTMQPMGTVVRQAGESPYAAELLFGKKAALTPGDVSERLRELGIPGSRYLDQGSRIDPVATQQKIALYEGLIRNDPTSPDIGNWANRIAEIKAEAAKPQTSNYAIFDPSIIEILRKYGILPPTIATGGLLAAGQETTY